MVAITYSPTPGGTAAKPDGTVMGPSDACVTLGANICQALTKNNA